jgi:glycosyltransferase involved in cell wall biosynthesis
MNYADKPDLICISVLDWDHPALSTLQGHIMRRLAAEGRRVFFVNQPLRWLNDYKATRHDLWLRRKLTAWKKGFVEIEPNFYSFTPPPLIPTNRFKTASAYRRVLAINSAIFRKALKHALKPYNVTAPILWNSLDPELGAATLGHFNEVLTVYQCIDELNGFKGLSSHLLELEKEIIRRSDLLIATSDKLCETKAVYNNRAYTVANAAEVAHFKQALNPLPLPSDLAEIPQPRFGFIGQLEQRFNFEMVYGAALARPDWHFVVIGPVREGYGDVPLLKLPNVHLLGSKSSKALPAYLRGLDVCLIPYKLDKLTAAIYPLKLHEYLAAGKPVLAGPLPSLYQFQEVIELVNSPEEFIAAGEHALRVANDPALVSARVAVAEKNSWEERVAAINRILAENLAFKASDGTKVLDYRTLQAT